MNNTSLSDAISQIDALDNLNHKDKNCLRLLTEEMFSMTNNLLKEVESSFEVKRNENDFELCLNAKANISKENQEKFVSLSSKRENISLKTIKGKMISVFEDFIYAYDDLPPGVSPDICMPSDHMYGYTASWSMLAYMNAVTPQEQEEAWDGMEKSIIANFADDIIIGARHKQVQMIIKKSFK